MDQETNVRVQQAKMACLKALGVMMSNNLAKSTLTAAAMAAKILQHFQLPYEVKVGYAHLPGAEFSFPHVWLDSFGGYVTDLTFSGPLRTIHILGQSQGFSEDAVKGSFSATALYPLPPRALSLGVLAAAAADFEVYLQNAPPGVRDAFQETLAKALDGDAKVQFYGISEDIMATMLPPGKPPGGQDDNLPPV